MSLASHCYTNLHISEIYLLAAERKDSGYYYLKLLMSLSSFHTKFKIMMDDIHISGVNRNENESNA